MFHKKLNVLLCATFMMRVANLVLASSLLMVTSTKVLFAQHAINELGQVSLGEGTDSVAFSIAWHPFSLARACYGSFELSSLSVRGACESWRVAIFRAEGEKTKLGTLAVDLVCRNSVSLILRPVRWPLSSLFRCL
jgi:hypothetical protein